jgi:DNA (cytosine-5)-methyltransferase 1
MVRHSRFEGSIVARPRLLDLFSGAGGAAMGYHRAGFDVVGVDNRKMGKSYPFEFIQADAMTFPLDGFDAIHASPPCQVYSITKHTHSREHPDLLAPIRERLMQSGVPWVIENVVGAPMDDPITLCGTMFNLTAIDDDGMQLYLRRHRLFESSETLYAPAECRCLDFRHRGWRVGGVYGGGSSDRRHAQFVRRGGYTPRLHVQNKLMGIDWMSHRALKQSIPPAYTEWIGAQLL